MGRSEARAGVCRHVRSQVLRPETVASYWWIFMGLMTTAVRHVGRVLPDSGNMSALRSRGGKLSGGKWTMCFAWSGFESKCSLITLPHHSRPPPPHPNPTTTLPFNLSLKRSINNLSQFYKWLEWSPPSSCHPHPGSATFITLLCVFHNPPSPPDAEVRATLSASWLSWHRWLSWHGARTS